MTSESSWSTPRPCRNEACPYGRPDSPAFTGFGTEIPTLCVRCEADEVAAEAEAELEARQENAWTELRRGVGEPILSWSLETYDDGDAARAEAARDAMVWMHVVLAGEPCDLYLWGKVGGGKTGLAWSVARELAQVHGVPGAFVVWRDVLAQLRESFDGGPGPDMRRLRRVPVLVLDDVGAEKPTEWASEQLAGLVDHRNGRLWTIYTSNYALSALLERLARDDEVVGKRIVSRIAQGARRIQLEAADRRLAR
jgi:DNA replication protein DnaC